MSPENASGGIAYALGVLGEALSAERTSLYQVSPEGDHYDRIAHWRSSVPEESAGAGWSCAELPWLTEQLSKQAPIRIAKLSELPPEASAEHSAWEARGIGSLIFVPMVSGGVLLGALEIELTEAETPPKQAVASSARLVAEYRRRSARLPHLEPKPPAQPGPAIG